MESCLSQIREESRIEIESHQVREYNDGKVIYGKLRNLRGIKLKYVQLGIEYFDQNAQSITFDKTTIHFPGIGLKHKEETDFAFPMMQQEFSEYKITILSAKTI